MQKYISYREKAIAFRWSAKRLPIFALSALAISAQASEGSGTQEHVEKTEAAKIELLCVGEKHYTDKASELVLRQFANAPVEISLSGDMRSAFLDGFTPRFRLDGRNFLESSIAASEPYEITATPNNIDHSSSSIKKIGDITELSSFTFSLDRRTGVIKISDEVYSFNTKTGESNNTDKVLGTYKCMKKQKNLF